MDGLRHIVENTLVPHSAFVEASIRIDQCMKYAVDSPEPVCLAIVGESRTGKTRVLEEYASKHSPVRTKEGLSIPILAVKSPSKPTVKGMAELMLQIMGDPRFDSGAENAKTIRLKRLMKKLEPYIAKGYVTGIDGRKVWIRSEHAALNSLLQSAGAIVAKQWIVCMSEELHRQKVPYKLLAWVHDELQCETPIGYGDIVGKIAVEAARKAGDVLKFRCPVDAEYRTGSNWLDCH